MTKKTKEKIARLTAEIAQHEENIRKSNMEILEMNRKLIKRRDNQIWLQDALASWLPLWYINWKFNRMNKGL